MSRIDDLPYSRPPKQKALHQKASTASHLQLKDPSNRIKGSFPAQTAQKASKRSLKNEPSIVFQQPERSNSDSLPDSSSASGNEYRALRRKYLLLEEESFTLGAELKEVEDEVKTLEEEKLGLLDELLVLEGLIDRSELQLAHSNLPHL
ncbi:hypothetical protein IC582_018585 [Cucumis melo]|uniref:Uncharacterized protein n=2 Tax=Cucumis melo TaxID=3656 RepID=A0A5D3CLN1_CUCMM|nr:uncharacterized protein E6C27_scaffold253G00910 [Cucumis melo var. makuwa]TYK12475.1 uncharacterized protein E5676_scaffold255G00520 [Cucumis melo var. makuwa]